jgi:hypothetical protein
MECYAQLVDKRGFFNRHDDGCVSLASRGERQSAFRRGCINRLKESLSVAQLLRSSYLADHLQEYGLHSDSMYGSSTPIRCCDNWTTSR